MTTWPVSTTLALLLVRTDSRMAQPQSNRAPVTIANLDLLLCDALPWACLLQIRRIGGYNMSSERSVLSETGHIVGDRHLPRSLSSIAKPSRAQLLSGRAERESGKNCALISLNPGSCLDGRVPSLWRG